MLASNWLFIMSPSSTPCRAYITSRPYLSEVHNITQNEDADCGGDAVPGTYPALHLNCTTTYSHLLQDNGMHSDAWRGVRACHKGPRPCRRVTTGQRLTSSHASSDKHYVIALFTNQVTKPSLTGRAQHHIAVLPIEYDSRYRP